MERITLKDNRFRIIGYVEIDDKGNKKLKDERFRILGYYDARSNTTKDERFHIIAHGDILTTLLVKK